MNNWTCTFKYILIPRSLFKADRLMFAMHLVHGMHPEMFTDKEWDVSLRNYQKFSLLMIATTHHSPVYVHHVSLSNIPLQVFTGQIVSDNMLKRQESQQAMMAKYPSWVNQEQVLAVSLLESATPQIFRYCPYTANTAPLYYQNSILSCFDIPNLTSSLHTANCIWTISLCGPTS